MEFTRSLSGSGHTRGCVVRDRERVLACIRLYTQKPLTSNLLRSDSQTVYTHPGAYMHPALSLNAPTCVYTPGSVYMYDASTLLGLYGGLALSVSGGRLGPLGLWLCNLNANTK